MPVPLTRLVALTLSGTLFWNPLLSAAAELAVDRNVGGRIALASTADTHSSEVSVVFWPY